MTFNRKTPLTFNNCSFQIHKNFIAKELKEMKFLEYENVSNSEKLKFCKTSNNITHRCRNILKKISLTRQKTNFLIEIYKKLPSLIKIIVEMFAKKTNLGGAQMRSSIHASSMSVIFS